MSKPYDILVSGLAAAFIAVNNPLPLERKVQQRFQEDAIPAAVVLQMMSCSQRFANLDLDDRVWKAVAYIEHFGASEDVGGQLMDEIGKVDKSGKAYCLESAKYFYNRALETDASRDCRLSMSPTGLSKMPKVKARERILEGLLNIAALQIMAEVEMGKENGRIPYLTVLSENHRPVHYEGLLSTCRKELTASTPKRMESLLSAQVQ
jgi:hypothetical protein